MTGGAIQQDLPFSFLWDELIEKSYQKGKVNILGITGQAGSLKTSIAREILLLCEKKKIPSAHLPADACFFLSRNERLEFLEEGKKIGDEEYARRADQWGWWDFDLMKRVLYAIRHREPVHLQNAYHRENRGEKTLSIDILVPEEGLLLVFEGVAISHIPGVDCKVYLHASAPVRFDRLRKRDSHRTEVEALERFALTQKFERSYFPSFWGEFDHFINTEHTPPRLLLGLEPRRAL